LSKPGRSGVRLLLRLKCELQQELLHEAEHRMDGFFFNLVSIRVQAVIAKTEVRLRYSNLRRLYHPCILQFCKHVRKVVLTNHAGEGLSHAAYRVLKGPLPPAPPPHSSLGRNDGPLYCETHKSTLVRQAITGDVNPPDLGHVSAWVCLPSGNTYMEAQGGL
jgi:hypothetical protein